MNKLLLALSLLSSPTLAANQAIYLGGWSKHLNGDADNETHWFHAYEYNNWQIGGFINSHNDYTVEVSYNFVLGEYRHFEYGSLVGLSYGYKEEDVDFLNYNRFMPIVVPYVAYTEYQVQPVVGLLGSAVFFTVRYEW